MNLGTFLTVLAIAWPIAVWAIRYPDSVLRLLVRERRLMTWHLETLVIGAASAALVVASGGGTLQWMAWAGGMAGHGSSSVGRRMYEGQARAAAGGAKPDVHCWHSQREYSYTARMWFAGVNLMLGWYGALASIALGVLYDQWRELYTRRRRAPQPPREVCGLPVFAGPCVLPAGHGGHTQDGGCSAIGPESERKLAALIAEHRRAVTARGLTMDKVIAHLRELADQEEQAAAAVPMAAYGERQEAESEQHDHAAAALRGAAADIEHWVRT